MGYQLEHGQISIKILMDYYLLPLEYGLMPVCVLYWIFKRPPGLFSVGFILKLYKLFLECEDFYGVV